MKVLIKMKDELKKLYIWAYRDHMSTNEMEERCLQNMFVRRAMLESSVGFMLDGYSCVNIRPDKDIDHETLRLVMRYRYE